MMATKTREIATSAIGKKVACWKDNLGLLLMEEGAAEWRQAKRWWLWKGETTPDAIFFGTTPFFEPNCPSTRLLRTPSNQSQNSLLLQNPTPKIGLEIGPSQDSPWNRTMSKQNLLERNSPQNQPRSKLPPMLCLRKTLPFIGAWVGVCRLLCQSPSPFSPPTTVVIAYH